MRKIILTLFFTLLLSATVFPQNAEKLYEFENVICELYLARMDSVIADAQNNPSASVYVMVYEGKESRFNSKTGKLGLVFPAIGTAKAKIASVKKYISKVRNFSVDRFNFVEAGFRENLTVEIWLVPFGSAQPETSPTLTKMKYRKGKATGFCLRCC